MPTVITVYEDGQGSDLETFNISTDDTSADWECSLSGATHPQQGTSTAHFAIRDLDREDIIVYREHIGDGTTTDSGTIILSVGNYEIEVWKSGGNRNITASGSITYTEESTTEYWEYDADTSRSVIQDSLQNGDTKRTVTVDHNYSADTYRHIVIDYNYDADTLREVIILVEDTFNADTLRQVIADTSINTDTLRTVVEDDAYSSDTSRRTLRDDIYNADTLRSVIILIQDAFSADTLRQVTTDSSCNTDTKRIVTVDSSWDADTLRKVIEDKVYDADTLREVVILIQDTYQADTLRQVLKDMDIEHDTLRIVHHDHEYLADTIREVIVDTSDVYLADTLRIVVADQEALADMRRAIVRDYEYLADTLRYIEISLIGDQYGTYFSPTIQASNLLKWDRLIYLGENLTKDVDIKPYTRTSNDGLEWTDWKLVEDFKIKSPPRPLLQYKIEIEFPAQVQPTITSIKVSYVEDPRAQLRVKSDKSPWTRHMVVHVEGEYKQVRVRSKGSDWVVGRIQ